MSLRSRGFTLIELAVAIFITAILFAIGYGAVNQAVNNREALEERQERLLAVQTTMRVIAQDINQLALRPIRDNSGNNYLPVLRASGNSERFLELTRGGWANPAGVQRPALQRVTYVLEDKKLRREYTPVLDSLLTEEKIKRDLCTGVKSATFRYMDVSRAWRETWPPQSTVPGADLRYRPIAVEVTLDLEDWGKIKRIFEVPT
jgi:general secretion pathway protein J